MVGFRPRHPHRRVRPQPQKGSEQVPSPRRFRAHIERIQRHERSNAGDHNVWARQDMTCTLTRLQVTEAPPRRRQMTCNARNCKRSTLDPLNDTTMERTSTFFLRPGDTTLEWQRHIPLFRSGKIFGTRVRRQQQRPPERKLRRPTRVFRTLRSPRGGLQAGTLGSPVERLAQPLTSRRGTHEKAVQDNDRDTPPLPQGNLEKPCPVAI